jgi:hypothetical protein
LPQPANVVATASDINAMSKRDCMGFSLKWTMRWTKLPQPDIDQPVALTTVNPQV